VLNFILELFHLLDFLSLALVALGHLLQVLLVVFRVEIFKMVLHDSWGSVIPLALSFTGLADALKHIVKSSKTPPSLLKNCEQKKQLIMNVKRMDLAKKKFNVSDLKGTVKERIGSRPCGETERENKNF